MSNKAKLILIAMFSLLFCTTLGACGNQHQIYNNRKGVNQMAADLNEVKGTAFQLAEAKAKKIASDIINLAAELEDIAKHLECQLSACYDKESESPYAYAVNQRMIDETQSARKLADIVRDISQRWIRAGEEMRWHSR